MEKIILCDVEDIDDTIQQEVYSYCIEVVRHLGVPPEQLKFLPERLADLKVEDKILLRRVLKSYRISIVEVGEGGRIDLQEKEIPTAMAEWAAPSIIYRSDIDTPRRLFCSISFSFKDWRDDDNG